MKKLLFIVSICICTSSFSQYYYNDIIANIESNQGYSLLKSNKIKTITVSSFDANNQLEKNFSLTQEFTADFKKMVTKSTTATGATSIITTLYKNNKIASTNEMTDNIETKSEYSYNESSQLKSIISSSKDTALKSKSIETHIWFYNESNKPTLMLKIKNNSDTTRIEMVLDNHGNIVEEHWKRGTKTIETYYYYYNENEKLTDIVRFNKRAQKLLPDFLFEYDTKGRLSKMIQVPAGNSNYSIWQYSYNDQGLKQEESCTNRQKDLIGKVVYRYQ